MLQRLHLAHSPQRRTFAMAVGSHTVRIWTLQPRLFHLGEDAATHGYSLEMDTGHMGIVGLEFLDDHTLLCVHADGVLQVWTLSTPDQPSEPFDTSQSFFQQNVPTMGRLEVYGRDRRIERASTNMRARLTWELHLDVRLDACDIIFVKDRLRVLLGGTRGEIYWVEILPNMPPIAVHIGQLSSGITLAKLSPTGDRGATASRDRRIAIWRPLEELPIDDNTGAWRVFGETGGEVWALAFSNSGRYLAGGGIDNGVYLWDLLAKNSLRAVSYDHEGWISDLAWSQEDRVLACASWDNTVGIFRGADLAPLYCFEYHQDYVSQVAFVPNSNYLISSSYDRSLAVWDWRNAELVKELREHTDWIQALEWLGHGTFMSAASDKSIRVWSSATLSCEIVLGEGKEDDWLSASLGSMEGLERRSAATSGGFKTIRPTEHAANLDAKLRRALAAMDTGLGGEVSMFFEALPEEERDRVHQLSEKARSRRLEEERAATDEFHAVSRRSSVEDESSNKTLPVEPPRETVAGLPATVIPDTDDAPSYSVSEVGIGDRISSEISNPSELVESSIADDEEVDPKPPGSLLRGVQTATTTEHSGLFALEYSEGTIERLRSPFHVSNSGLLDLQEARSRSIYRGFASTRRAMSSSTRTRTMCHSGLRSVALARDLLPRMEMMSRARFARRSTRKRTGKATATSRDLNCANSSRNTSPRTRAKRARSRLLRLFLRPMMPPLSKRKRPCLKSTRSTRASRPPHKKRQDQNQSLKKRTTWRQRALRCSNAPRRSSRRSRHPRPVKSRSRERSLQRRQRQKRKLRLRLSLTKSPPRSNQRHERKNQPRSKMTRP